MKNTLLQHRLLRQIDIYFAGYICRLQESKDENLWILAALISNYVNRGDSAFDPSIINARPVREIFSFSESMDETIGKDVGDMKIPVFDVDKLLENKKAIGVINRTYQPDFFNPADNEDETKPELKPIIYDGNLFFINKFFKYEQIIADFLAGHAVKPDDISDMADNFNELFPDNFEEDGTTVNWQKVAAMMALRSGFSIISGGPGTGKTTTVGKILALLLEKDQNLIIRLVAPTGKASDRLSNSIKAFKHELVDTHGKASEIIDAIPENAETIHKFIGINSTRPKYTKYSPAPIDVLVIDEASMVSLPLFAKTFEALSDECKVILLGDKDQLMAVENGNVLQDMTDTETLNAFSADFTDCVAELTKNEIKLDSVKKPALIEDAVIQLEHSYRFDENSGIGHLSKAVNNSDTSTAPEELLQLFEKYDDIDIIEKSTEEDVNKYVRQFCAEHLKDYKNALDAGKIEVIMASLSEFRILCAVNEGPFGVNEINELIEKMLLKKSSSDSFYHGRPVLITQNDYKLKLMNGDVGVIAEDEYGELKAYFPGEGDTFREFNPASLGEHKTAFTISIHKSQGSEYNNVFVILPPEENKILTKELIYTAITRAKEKCTVIANPEIFHKAAITKMVRQSGLKNKLAQ